MGVSTMRIERWKGGRFWAVYDVDGSLVCVTVYRKGAMEVVRRLQQSESVDRGEGEGAT